MAAVFAELERGMIRERVMAGLERAKAQGKGKGGGDTIRVRLGAGEGILKGGAKALGVGTSTVQRVKQEAAARSA